MTDNTTTQSTTPPPEKTNRWIRLARKVLIWGLISYAVNYGLEKTGWKDWNNVQHQADIVTESMINGAARLSPITLWKSLMRDQYSIIVEKNATNPYYPPTYRRGEKITLKEKIFSWLGAYWYTDNGKSFWFGRIILIFAVVVAFSVAWEDYEKSKSVIVLPFNIIAKFFIFLLGLGIVSILLYFVIKILVLIVGAVVFLVTSARAVGGLAGFILEEARGAAVDSSKKTLTSLAAPLLFRKKK